MNKILNNAQALLVANTITGLLRQKGAAEVTMQLRIGNIVVDYDVMREPNRMNVRHLAKEEDFEGTIDFKRYYGLPVQGE